MENLNKKLIAWAILLTLVCIWGSSFILIKRGLDVFSNQEVGALRIVISFLFLLPFAITKLKKVKGRDWFYLSIVGIVGSGAPAFLFAKAQTGIDSNLAGILNSLTPLFTLLIGAVFFNLKSRWFNVFGIGLGLIGAIGLMSISGGQSLQVNLSYAFYIILATICYAINVNVLKKYLKSLNAITITSFSFFIIGFPVTIYLLGFTDFVKQMQTDDQFLAGLGYVAILAILGTGLALVAFNYLIKISSPIFAASVTYMIPVIAILWGMIDGEQFEAIYLAWILIILLGVFLVNLNYQSKIFSRFFK